MDYLQRRRIKLEEIVNIEQQAEYKSHMYDIEVPHLNLRIEVKGCKGTLKNGNEATFRVNLCSYHPEANLYAFVFNKSGFVIFLTKREFLDLAGRRRLKEAGRKTITIYQHEVIRKSLHNENVYNY